MGYCVNELAPSVALFATGASGNGSSSVVDVGCRHCFFFRLSGSVFALGGGLIVFSEEVNFSGSVSL